MTVLYTQGSLGIGLAGILISPSLVDVETSTLQFFNFNAQCVGVRHFHFPPRQHL